MGANKSAIDLVLKFILIKTDSKDVFKSQKVAAVLNNLMGIPLDFKEEMDFKRNIDNAQAASGEADERF